MAKKRMSSEGKKFLNDLKSHTGKGGTRPASMYEFNSRKYDMEGPVMDYSRAHNMVSKGKKAHFTEVDKSNLTGYDLAKINSYISMQAEKDLEWNGRIMEYFVDSASAKGKNPEKVEKAKGLSKGQKTFLDRRIKNAANGISYLNEHGDKLKAKDFAKKLGKTLHPLDAHGENELYKAAKIDKEFSKNKIGRIKSDLEDSVNPWFSILTIVGIGAAIFFLSPTLTGNAIANLTTKTSSLIGVGLFVAGMTGLYFWFKRK